MLAGVALACFRRPVLATLVLALLGALGTWSTTRLVLDPDVTDLMPRSYESVREVERLRQRFGGVGNVVLVVEGGSADARRRFADAIAPELETLDSVKFVDHRVPVEFFVDRGLYFMDRPDLETLRDRLNARKRWEIERSYIDLDDEPPPSVDVADLTAKYEERFSRQLGRSGREGRSAYHEDEAEERLAIFVRPNALASDLEFARQVVSDVERTIARHPPTEFDPSMKVELTGRYKKRVDLQAVLGRDLARTSVLAAGLVVLYVALHFRRGLAVGLVLLPLILGVAWSYGLAGALFGKLNILTAFIGAILAGITIDNGLHLLGRFQEERGRGASDEEAVVLAFGEAGRVSLAAALTAAAAFVALTWTDFRAFREFGVLAASGMVLLLLAYVTLIPALLGLLARHAPRWSNPPPARRLPGVAWMSRFSPPLFWVLALLGFLVVTHAYHVRFDADFSKLDDADLPSFRLDEDVNRLLGRSQTPMVVLASGPEEAREVAETVRERMRALGDDATVGLVATRADLLPIDQEAKQDVLRDVRKTLSHFKGTGLDDAARKDVERLRTMAAAAPFTAGDLPPSLRHVFEPKEGTGPADFVLLYPTVSTSDASAIKQVAAQLRRIELADGRSLPTAGEGMVVADVLLTVERDAPRILALTLVLVLLSLFLTLGNFRLALLAASPAIFTLVATLGAAALLGLDLNYLNMIVLPILLGIGVDDGAHLLARVEAGDPLTEVWGHTGWDVTGAILTDVFGFGVLVLAAHPGLRSLGTLAIVGLFINFLACVVMLPAALSFLPLAGPGRARWSLAEWIVTVAGAGRSPLAPGTVGALATIPIAWALADAGLVPRVVVMVLLVGVAVVASEGYLRRRSRFSGASKDPQEIVVDETVGCAVALVFVPFEPAWVVAGFVLFRAFDILKPGPIGWADRRLSGGFGVVADDVLAGLGAAAILVGLRTMMP